MEKSSRRSKSLNFEVSNLFVGSSYPPTFNLVPNSKMYSSHESGLFKLPFSRTLKMNHSISMDDTVNSISDTKKNIVQSMTGIFGSLKNLVSKIPNFMSNINSPLSVTVVPNEGILTPEDIIHNLTGSSEGLVSSENSLGLFDRGNKLPTNPAIFSNETSQISEMFATKFRPSSPIHTKFKNVDDILGKTWNNDYTENYLKPEYMNISSYGSPSSAVKSITKSSSKGDLNIKNISEHHNPEVDIDLVDHQDVNSKLTEVSTFLEQITLSYLSSSSDSESPMKNFNLSKQPQKGYTSVKYELRSRKSSESSTDSDDSFIVFEEESQTELNYDYESSSDGNTNHGENQKSSKPKQFFQQQLSVDNDLRSRRSSESSIDSESSCSIVFKDEHDYPDFNCKISNDEDSNDDKKSSRKVRFNLQPIVHLMLHWRSAYEAARIGPWEAMGRDRERFHRKINCLSQVLNPILTREHRQNIWQIRFANQD